MKYTMLLMISLLLCTGTNQSLADFIPLGFTFGSAVSADGSVVVGQNNAGQAVRWTQATGAMVLDPAPGILASDAFPSAVSAGGSVVVGQGSFDGLGDEGGFQAFRWTQATGMVPLGDLPGGGGVLSGAADVSADGTVVVGGGSVGDIIDESDQAFRWTQASGLVALPFSYAEGVSADGSVVVGYDGNMSIRWTQATGAVPLGSGQAFAVSADGSVVVGRTSLAEGVAYRWTQATGMVPLSGFAGLAFDVSADGSVVVGTHNVSTSSPVAFLWDEAHGMRNLKDLLISQGDNLAGWSLEFARGISADGTLIVGDGINPNGQREAWMARVNVIPEPASLGLMGLGLVGLAGLCYGSMRQNGCGRRD